MFKVTEEQIHTLKFAVKYVGESLMHLGFAGPSNKV